MEQTTITNERRSGQQDIDSAEKTANETPDDVDTAADATVEADEWKPDGRFWAIFVSMTMATLVAGLENSIIIIPLPKIVSALDAGSNYVWVANIHFLTGAAVLPVLGQAANLFGRRFLTLFVLCIYVIGCGLCGGAHNAVMFLIGRGVQGAGGSGILLMTEIVIADLAPVKKRPQYIGMVMGISGIGSIAAPTIGGAIADRTTWRWIFWLNMPICGVALVLVYIFLRVKWNRNETISQKLARMDWAGNALVMGSTVSVTVAFTWAGSVHSWSSAQVLAPLIIGFAGLVAFFCYETTVKEPLLPLHILNNRTAIILFINTFLSNGLLYWVYFFVPVYYQAVLDKSPIRAAVLVLPLAMCTVPSIVICSTLLTKTGHFKWMHVVGFAVWCVGIGTMSSLTEDSSLAKYVCVQIPCGLAVGGIICTILPAFQGAAPEKDQAAATASWTWIRACSYVWGVSIAAVIFNAYMAQAATGIQDAAVRTELSDGNAFQLATQNFVDQFEGQLRAEIRTAFDKGYQKVILIAIAFTGLGLILSLFEKNIKLRTEIETEFGLENRRVEQSSTASQAA